MMTYSHIMSSKVKRLDESQTLMVISHLSKQNVSSKSSIARQYKVKNFPQKLNLHFLIIFCEVRRDWGANLNGCELNW